MTAIVKELKEMPIYLKLLFVGTDERGAYGFSVGMQKKMGKRIEIKPVSAGNISLYDYIDNDGCMYREDWLKGIE